MTPKTAQIFTVRNSSGQFLGTYRQVTAEQAIKAFKDEQTAYFSTFRSRTNLDLEGLTAKVELRGALG